MALARVHTWSAGEVLLAADLNAEVNNLLNNAADLVSPFTKAISMGGFALNFDAANTIAMTATTSGVSLTGGTFREPVEDTITAFATGGQANGTALSASKKFHRISVCATTDDSVKLPTSTAGQWHYIRNDGAAAARVFGTTPDTINSVATATGVPLPAGMGCLYVCTTAGNWTASQSPVSVSGNFAVTFTATAATNVTLPVTGTLATLAGAEALTNKTITVKDANFTLQDDGDVTKQAQFQVSAVAASTTRTISVPNSNVTLGMGRAFISGLTYANSSGDATNDIDVAAGSCTDATNTVDMVLAATITKQLDAAWAVGTNAGGLDTGAIGNSDYYIWLIKRSDTGVVDALYSLSSTAPTMPTSYDFKRLIGWFKRVGGTIVAFTTYETEGGGLELKWTTPTLDINLANTLTAARRTDAVKVPLNFSTIALLRVFMADAGSGFSSVVCCPDEADAAPSVAASPLTNFRAPTNADQPAADINVRTSSAGLIAARSDLATVDTYLAVTLGFRWARRA